MNSLMARGSMSASGSGSTLSSTRPAEPTRAPLPRASRFEPPQWQDSTSTGMVATTLITSLPKLSEWREQFLIKSQDVVRGGGPVEGKHPEQFEEWHRENQREPHQLRQREEAQGSVLAQQLLVSSSSDPGTAVSAVVASPIRPLQRRSKPRAPAVTIQALEDNIVRPAAMVLEKPKGRQNKINTMTAVQIAEKLRKMVSADDPKALYSKIKRIGQKLVACVSNFEGRLLILAHSASGHVYLAKAKATGKNVTIKEKVLSRLRRKENVMREILVMKNFQHPHIINFIGSYLVEGNELWVVTEYMGGGPLTAIIENYVLQEDQISSICLQVCCRLVPFGLVPE